MLMWILHCAKNQETEFERKNGKSDENVISYNIDIELNWKDISMNRKKNYK